MVSPCPEQDDWMQMAAGMGIQDTGSSWKTMELAWRSVMKVTSSSFLLSLNNSS
jgi:hypothetical protein